MIVNNLTDLLTWNNAFDALTRPTGILNSTTPNSLRYVLTDPRARDTFPDWSTVADEQVSYLHFYSSATEAPRVPVPTLLTFRPGSDPMGRVNKSHVR